MNNEKIYVKGFRTFKPNETAPDFVLGDLIISIGEFEQFIKENENLLTEYQGKKQLKTTIKKSKDGGVYFEVNTYKPE
jgi:hypothetical protein